MSPNGDINYDTQPSACRTVVLSLPSGSTPFDIYCAADSLIDDDAVWQELAEPASSEGRGSLA